MMYCDDPLGVVSCHGRSRVPTPSSSFCVIVYPPLHVVVMLYQPLSKALATVGDHRSCLSQSYHRRQALDSWRCLIVLLKTRRRCLSLFTEGESTMYSGDQSTTDPAYDTP